MNKKAFIAAIIILAFLTSTVAAIQVVEVAKAQSSATVTINPDGSVIGTNNIQRNGDVYTLTGNISGGIQVQKSNIILDGAGYAIIGDSEFSRGIDLSNGRGQDPLRPEVNNVTVKNLKILNFYYGVDNVNTHSNTFIGNYIENCLNGFWMSGYDNLITYNTMNNASIAINYAGRSNITNNNFINCWVMVWASSQQIVDGNYWSDYTTRYPNAKEIEKSGFYNLFWDTPYAYWENTVDNHPLINPVSTSSISTPTSTSSPISTSTLSPSPTPPPSPLPSRSPTLNVTFPPLSDVPPTIVPTSQPTTSDGSEPVRIVVFAVALAVVSALAVSLYRRGRKD